MNKKNIIINNYLFNFNENELTFEKLNKKEIEEIKQKEQNFIIIKIKE